MKKRVILAHVCALLTMFIWGSAFVSTKVLLKDFNPVEILFYRFLLGYIFLWIIRPRILRMPGQEKKKDSVRRRLLLPWRIEIHFALAGFTGILLDYLFENTALLYTGAAVVSVIVGAAPFILGVLAYVILKQKPNKYFPIGFVLAIIGIAIICFEGEESVNFHWLGELISLCACLAWAFYGLFSEKINNQNFDVILVTRRLFFYGTLYILPLYLLFGNPKSLIYFRDPVNLVNILYLGLGACVFAFVIWNYAISVLGSVMTNVYVYLLPVFTIILSALILHEKITFAMVLGTVLTLIGLALSERKVK